MPLKGVTTTILKLGQNGRIIIPADVRRNLDFKAGDELLITIDDKRLILETEAALLARLYRAAGSPPEGELVSDTLLRERRDEAAREAAEW